MSRITSASANPDPERWTSRPPGEASAEDHFGTAFRAAAAVTALDQAPTVGARGRRPRRRRTGALPIALVVLTAGGGAVWATHGWLRARPPAPEVTSMQPPGRARVRRPRAIAPKAPEPTAAVVAPLPPAPVEPVAPPPRRAQIPAPPTRATPPAPALVPVPPESPAPPSETALLAQAFRALRTDRDPGAALAALDEHARRFPRGHLKPESELARVEALVMLGRSADALAALDAVRSPRGAASRRPALMRAELRAELGRCQQALPDFDEALAGTAADEIDERALRGRAACRERLGDLGGARADLDRHLRRHPTSPFAAEIRRRQGAIVAP